MSYNEKINEVRNELKNNNFENAILKLQNMLKEVKEKDVENENNTYYAFGNYAEEAIFYNIFGNKKKNIYPEYNISEIYYLLGFVNIDLKNYGLAINYLDEALKWNPINVAAMFEKATAFRASGNIERFKAEIEKTYIYIYNSNYLSKYYRELGWYFVERKLFGLGNALYTYSNYFYKTDTAENELKYIAQQENRKVMYTPITEITQYLRDYNIPVNFHKGIMDCIFNGLQQVKNNIEKRPIARYFSNLMYDMTLSKDFVWFEPIKNEKYGIQIEKPDHWQIISKEFYEKYGLNDNTVFAFWAPQIGLYTVTYVEKCTNRDFEEKFNNIIENFKNSGVQILSQFLEPKEKNFGKICIERQINEEIVRLNEDYVLANNILFKISWASKNIKTRAINDEIASDIEKSLKTINEIVEDRSFNNIEENNSIDLELQTINSEFIKNGLNENLYNILNDFSRKHLKDDGPDPFWKDYAILILNAILVLVLVDKNKISIDEIKEKSKNMNYLRKYCEEVLPKIDIVNIQHFPELMEGITTIRKNDADRTMSSLLEIINKSF